MFFGALILLYTTLYHSIPLYATLCHSVPLSLWLYQELICQLPLVSYSTL